MGGSGGECPKFSTYDFTDISTGFFEKARSKFEAWGDHVSYKALNIEKDLGSQGFQDSEAYDVVIAANVLHATQKMDHTMSQVHRLLKPGGKLILVEVTTKHKISGEIIFGLLPGWWMGVGEGRDDGPLLLESEWSSLLKHNGFTGLDICLRDTSDEKLYSFSMMTTTKMNKEADMAPSQISIVYDRNCERPLADSLGNEITASLGLEIRVLDLKEIRGSNEFFVIIDHTMGSLLLDLDEERLQSLKSLFAPAKGVLWVTFGERANPDAGAVPGFMRAMRSENGGMKYCTCHVDSAEGLSKVVKVIEKTFNEVSMKSATGDYEYRVDDSRIMIPRVVEDRKANEALSGRLGVPTPEEQVLWQEDRFLRLDMGHVGLLDTFHFVHNDSFDLPIMDDEVEIEVKTVGLNFHDLMCATGQLPDPNGYGVECSGTIVKASGASNRLNVGDRVCTVAPASFATHVRAPQSMVCAIPDDMSFEIAASIPSVFTTVYYCIYHAARLQKNESILIHSAAGGVGQACIKFAQLIGAEIFVTTSPSKVDFLMSKFGLPRDRIFNSRTLEFGSRIMRATKGKGVDTVINSLAGDALRESWRCMAMFGRFIELGKKDSMENARLDMGPFERSASFISVGWDHFGSHRQQFVGSVLQTVISLFAKGTLTPLEPITVYPMSDIEPAFRFMASGDHIGKIVVTADQDCHVKVSNDPRYYTVC